MSTDINLTVESRDVKGTAASRRLRHGDKVPGIIYGAGKGNENILFAHSDIMHRLDTPAFYSSVISLSTPSGDQQVILREVQRHPYRARVLHVDFQRISASEKLHMNVPLHFDGGEEAPGVTMDGGILSFLVMELDVTCLPKDLPEYISVDVSQLGLNQSVHLSDIQLPEGVELTSAVSPGDEDITLANVAPPKVMEEEEEAEDALAAEGEEEAGGDDAPDAPDAPDASGDAQEKASED